MPMCFDCFQGHEKGPCPPRPGMVPKGICRVCLEHPARWIATKHVAGDPEHGVPASYERWRCCDLCKEQANRLSRDITHERI